LVPLNKTNQELEKGNVYKITDLFPINANNYISK
jgi:hypothetical protein